MRSRRRSHRRSSNGSGGQGRDGAQRQWAAAAEVALHRTEVAKEAAASYYSFCSCQRQQWVLFDAHGLLWRSREAAAAVVERSAPRPLTATRFACIGEGGEFDLSQGGEGVLRSMELPTAAVESATAVIVAAILAGSHCSCVCSLRSRWWQQRVIFAGLHSLLTAP